MISIENVESYTVAQPSDKFRTGTVFYNNKARFGAYDSFSIHLEFLDGQKVIYSVPELTDENEEEIKQFWESTGHLEDSLVHSLIEWISPA